MTNLFSQTVTVFGFVFHTYGLIVGVAVVVGLLAVEQRLKLLKGAKEREQKRVAGSDLGWLNENLFWQGVLVVLLSGVVGARLWHVVTDFEIYRFTLVDAFKIWQGGLSILGAIAGGVVGLWLWLKMVVKDVNKKNLWQRGWQVLDLAVFGLPLSQAIGRLGNFVNQELYGLPSRLPWAIDIKPEFRLSGFESFQTFHPLFAYEVLLLLTFTAGLWWLSLQDKFKNLLSIGSGRAFLSYIWFYSLIRFFLDFLRIDKSISPVLGLGVNQLVLIVVLVVTSTYWWQILRLKR